MRAPNRRLGLLIASLLLLAEASGGGIAIPRRTDPTKRQVVDRATVVFWQFEKGDASDATQWTNTGLIRGQPKAVPDGKFGKCLSLGGGKDAVLLPEIRGLTPTPDGLRMTPEFWMRFENAPEARQCVFELASSSAQPAIGLDILPDGKLALRGDRLNEAESKEPVPAGKWFHVAIVGYAKVWPRGIGYEYSGAAALVNGRRFVTAISEEEHYSFPPYTVKEAFSLGNSLAGDAGFVGRIDEFRFSGAARSYYQPKTEPWVGPGNREPVSRPAKFFRDPGAVAFYESFNDEDAIERLMDSVAERHSEPLVGTVEADLAQTEDEIDAAEGLLPETFDPGKTTEMRRVESGQCPGVRGSAVVLDATSAGGVIELPKGLNLTSGTIEFWFRPTDWDNFTLRPHRSQTPYLNSRLLLLTLYGRPKKGEGEDQILVKLVGDRLRSSREAPFSLHPYHWTYAMIVWGKGVQNHQPNYYLDGQWVGYDLRASVCKMAAAEIWESHVPAYLKLGNSMGTAYDELRIYDYPFLREEAGNAFGSYTGAPMQELGAALCSFDYKMTLGKLSVVLAATQKDPSQAGSAKVKFTLPHQNRTFDLEVPEFTNGRGRTPEIDVGELPEGEYPCRGVLLDKNGKELGRFNTPFQRVGLPWLHNRLGIVDTPPAPFTPVTVDGAKVQCVERDYTVGAGGLFDSVVVRGEEILSGPVQFEFTQAGRKAELAPEGRVRFTESKPVEANWQAAIKGGGLSIRLTVKFEYDGMAKVELKIAPTAGEATIDRLSMKIPLKAKCAEFLHVIPRAWAWHKIANVLPTSDGLIWDSKTATKRCKQEKVAVGNFMPMVWLGGRVRGLCFFADNDRGWVPNDEQPAITVSREKETVTLALHFITEPYTLKEPRTIVFGLLATPPKPLPANHRLWNRGNNQEVGVIGGRLTSCEAFAGWDLPPKADCFDFWPKDYDWEYAERAAAQQRVSKDPKYGNGKAHMMYQLPTFIPLSPRDGAYFQWEWFRSGGSRSASPYPPTKVDCLVWYLNEWFRRDIMDGIYLDGFTPAPDYNRETGTAYILPDGKIQPGNAFFGYRDYIKRMHAILVTQGKPPLITAHSTSAMPIPLLAFASVHFDGEDVARFRNPNITFMDAWSLDRLLTLNNYERTGLIPVLMLKGQYVTRGRNKEAWAHMIRRTQRSAWATWLLFDMHAGTLGGGLLGTTVRSYSDPGVKVHPFWSNEAAVTVEAVLKEPVTDEKLLPKRWLWTNDEFRRSIAVSPLRATLYQKPDRALVVVANFLRKPVDGRVRINYDALGVPKEQQARVSIRDVDDWGEAKGYDIQRMGTPDAEGEAAAIPLEAEKPEDESLGVKELELTKKKDRSPKLRDGVIALEVKDHDFRAVELMWGDKPEEKEDE